MPKASGFIFNQLSQMVNIAQWTSTKLREYSIKISFNGRRNFTATSGNTCVIAAPKRWTCMAKSPLVIIVKLWNAASRIIVLSL